jgi:DNA-binding winged helix-turn-helix (wHTH) protein
VPGQVQIGTRTQGRAETDAGEGPGREPDPAPPPGADGTLLAVVPIPGTGTSLAIVGYPVTAPEGVTPVPVPERIVRDAQVLAREALAAAHAVGLPGLLLDHEQRRVRVDGTEVVLTFQEFELLAFLHAHPATVFSRADLVRKVWQRDFTADSRTVDVHVSRLRRKLGPAYGRCLVTEYRVGYQFRPPADSRAADSRAADSRAADS